VKMLRSQILRSSREEQCSRNDLEVNCCWTSNYQHRREMQPVADTSAILRGNEAVYGGNYYRRNTAV
jgi:hypothetical protein